MTSVTISPGLAGSLGDGTAFTPTATAGQVLPSYEVTDSVVVLADADNAGAIFVGNSGVTTSHGFKLAAGNSIEVKCTNSSNIYIIGTADDHVYLTGVEHLSKYNSGATGGGGGSVADADETTKEKSKSPPRAKFKLELITLEQSLPPGLQACAATSPGLELLNLQQPRSANDGTDSARATTPEGSLPMF